MPSTYTIRCSSPAWEITIRPTDDFDEQTALPACLEALEGDWSSLVEALPSIHVPHREADRIRIPLEIIDACAGLVSVLIAGSRTVYLDQLSGVEPCTELNERLGLTGGEQLLRSELLVFRERLFPRTAPPQVAQLHVANIGSYHSTKKGQIRVERVRLAGEGLGFEIRDQAGTFLQDLLGLAVGESLSIPRPALALTCTSREDGRHYDGVYTSPDGTRLAFQLNWA